VTQRALGGRAIAQHSKPKEGLGMHKLVCVGATIGGTEGMHSLVRVVPRLAAVVCPGNICADTAVTTLTHLPGADAVHLAECRLRGATGHAAQL
jgi:predicted metal-binding protein